MHFGNQKYMNRDEKNYSRNLPNFFSTPSRYNCKQLCLKSFSVRQVSQEKMKQQKIFKKITTILKVLKVREVIEETECIIYVYFKKVKKSWINLQEFHQKDLCI